MKIKKYVMWALRLVNSLIPKNCISFCSNPDFSDNPQAFFAYLNENNQNENLKVIWHLQSKDNVNIVKQWIEKEYSRIDTKVVVKYTFGSILGYMKSKTIVSSHGLYGFRTKRQKELLLWHGMPLKRIGYMNPNDIEHGIAQGDYYSVTSSIFKELFIKIFRAEESQIYVCGQPRNDYLFEKYDGFGEVKNYIIFMPTFRKTNSKLNLERTDGLIDNDKLFGIRESEWKRLDEVLLQNDMSLVVKPHPLDCLNNLHFLDGLTRIHFVNDDILLRKNIPLYRFISGSVALITDYSSIYIDYLLTQKPIAFFIPDFAEYKKNRGFVFGNIEDTMSGDICTNVDSLIVFVSSLAKSELHYSKKEMQSFNEIDAPVSSKLIYECMRDLF